MKQVAAGIVLCTILIATRITSGDDGQSPDIALPAIETAGSDARGRITANGKPFFPILMYDVPIDPDSLKMFREHGFNTLSAPAENATMLRNHGFYVAAHGISTEGLKQDGVLFGVGMDSPALYWKDDLLDKSRADLANLRKIFPNRPIFHAIGYWEDEPAGVFSNKVPPKDRYEELVKVLDVSAPYLYPLPYQPVRSVGEAVARANVASGGKKPVLPVLQLFVWKPEDPYPTAAQLKCMAYLSLIHGADGIGYYSYNYVAGKEKTNLAREQPELWRSVKPINAEVKQVGEFLLDSTPEPAVRVKARDAAVEWRAAASGDSILLLVANTSSETQKVSVEWLSKSAALQRIDNGGKLHVENGAAEITLNPNEALGLFGEKPILSDDPDFLVQGEYQGEVNRSGKKTKIGVQVIALGKGTFRAVVYSHGLPGDGWDKSDTLEWKGATVGGVTTFKDGGGAARIENGSIVILAETTGAGKLPRVSRRSPTLGAKPPQGAVVLFDGKNADQFEPGRITDDGLLMQGATSKPKFESGTLHVEFQIPFGPLIPSRGNSGVYLQSRYEVQILDSMGYKPHNHECGGIPSVKAPDVTMSYPPLAWQTYDVDFTAAQFRDGKKTKNARMTVRHNGVVIHDDVEVPHITTSAPLEEGPVPGPLNLQDHGSQVRYRNLWFHPSKD